MFRKWMTTAVLAGTAALPLDRSDLRLTSAADAAPPATVASAWSGAAPCLAPERLSVRSIAARLNRLTGAAPKISLSVAGFRIEDEAAPLVEALRRLAPDTPSPVPSQAACHKALCASQALFGDEVGPRLLYLLVRYGYDGLPAEVPAPGWTAQSLDEALAAFGDLPANLLPLDGTVRSLADDHGLEMLQSDDRDPMNGDTPMAASGGELGGIRLGAAWDRAAPAERRASIVHELAHQFALSARAGPDWRTRWLRAVMADADWARRTGQPTSAVSFYAQRSLDEDFAESATAYRYMPDLLGMRAPNRYALLKDGMFDGLEYHSADQCQAVVAKSELDRLASAPGGPWPPRTSLTQVNAERR